MCCRRDILECLGNLSFKEFSRIRGVSRVLSGIRTGGRRSNPERCTLDRLIANELGPEGIVRGQMMRRKMKQEVSCFHHP